MVEKLPDKAGDAGGTGSMPGSGRSAGRGNGNRLQYSCLENPMDRKAWLAAVHEATELDMTENALIFLQIILGNLFFRKHINNTYVKLFYISVFNHSQHSKILNNQLILTNISGHQENILMWSQSL